MTELSRLNPKYAAKSKYVYIHIMEYLNSYSHFIHCTYVHNFVPCHMYLTQVLRQLQIIDISIISWRGVARPGLGWGDVGGQQSHGWRQLRPLDTH